MKKKYYVVLIIVLIALIGINTVYLNDFFNTNRSLKQDNNNYTQKIKEYSSLISENKEKEEEITNLNKAIKDLKEEFFKNASILEKKIQTGESSVKIAYITIDDGPYALSSKFLDVLKEKNAPSTFFWMYRGGHEDKYQRVLTEGHTLANHSFYHNIFGNNGIYRSVNNFITDVLRLENYIYEITGYKTDIFRFPGGSATARGLKSAMVEELRKNGYGYVDWHAYIGDSSGHPTVTQSVNNVMNRVKGHNIAVILMHDYSNTSLQALPIIIDNLRNQGYIFLPLFKDSVTVIK